MVNSRGSNGSFLCVDLSGGGNGTRERDTNVLRRLSIEFHHAQDNVVTGLSLLQSEHANTLGYSAEQERSFSLSGRRCFVGLESDQGIVKPIRLPIRLGLLPAAAVCRQPKYKFMVAPILICLIGVCLRASIGRRLHPRRPQQRQSKGVVVRLVGAVFAVGENGCPEGASLVG